MMTTVLLAAGSLLLTMGCGNVPGDSAASPRPEDDQPVSTDVGSPPATSTPGTKASPVRPEGNTINPRPIPFEQTEPSADGRSLKVYWWSGVEPCHVLDRVEVKEAAGSVTVTLFEGPSEPDAICVQIAVRKMTTVDLKAPLDDRRIVDGAK
ncbi:hypothetical protein [Sphaerisporangium aureirubrum]|uniref:Uncharacterized protein n=1 Tax=Sphaerisporangium aureirubrum TaxID=1544736 RepID=A0ABW1N7N7_9ACTN